MPLAIAPSQHTSQGHYASIPITMEEAQKVRTTSTREQRADFADNMFDALMYVAYAINAFASFIC
jgi:hypothetical protein